MLEFTSVVEGIEINGVDIITWDENGKITDFKVMVRPVKAVNKLWEKWAKCSNCRNPPDISTLSVDEFFAPAFTVR